MVLANYEALTLGAFTQSPVNVARCFVETPQGLPNNVNAGTITGNYALHVRFTNTSGQPLKRVVFALSDGTRVADAGMFAPGVTIDHILKLAPNTAASCQAASATFADGRNVSIQPAPSAPSTTAK